MYLPGNLKNTECNVSCSLLCGAQCTHHMDLSNFCGDLLQFVLFDRDIVTNLNTMILIYR